MALLYATTLALLLARLALARPGVHLTNCNTIGGQQSEINFYTQDPNGTLVSPNDKAVVETKGFINWEGDAVSGYFSDSGVTFTSHIQAGASGYSTGQYAGTGYNGSPWSCYRDNNRELYGNGAETCNSIYYCLQD